MIDLIDLVLLTDYYFWRLLTDPCIIIFCHQVDALSESSDEEMTESVTTDTKKED